MTRRSWIRSIAFALPVAVIAFAGWTSVSAQDKPKEHGKDAHAKGKTIVETATEAGNFKTLVELLQHAKLADTLKGDGPFTVFAPTDEAFAKLGKETLDNLKKPENEAKLRNILLYHVVSGKQMAADVSKMKDAKTMAGQSVTIKSADGKVMIDTATVTKTDIAASNGVIHVIDTVLMPKDTAKPGKSAE